MAKLFKVEVKEFFGSDGGNGNTFDVAQMSTPRRMEIVRLLLKKDDGRIEEIIIDLLKHHQPLSRRMRSAP